MKKLLKALTISAALLAMISPAVAEKDPYTAADETWISLSGTVEAVSADSFTLDYGDGIVTVEMDDGDRDADGYKLIKGDKVTVSGRVDDDLFESTTIEASSVYVENIGTHFYASAIDDEDAFVTVVTPIEPSDVIVQGMVTAVRDDEFTIDSGAMDLTVEVDTMPYNPLDDKGYQKIEVGDRVSVRGHVDHDLFEGYELEAESVITLSD